jgi:hypothetical protein
MRHVSYKQGWVDNYARNREYFADSVDPFRNWENRDSHGDWAEWFLSNALATAYSDAPGTIVRKFASAAVEIVDRTLAENQFEQGKLAQADFPMNQAVALRARAYAKVLIGESLGTEDLLQASRDFEARAVLTWNHQYEAYYLNGVRAALLAGDHDRFVRLLKTNRKFKWHVEEFAVLHNIAEQPSLGTSGSNAELTDRFRILFDRYRDPDFKPDMYLDLQVARFELGAIWCQLFDQPNAFGWQRVISAISE